MRSACGAMMTFSGLFEIRNTPYSFELISIFPHTSIARFIATSVAISGLIST
jgi:hypothetical protein